MHLIREMSILSEGYCRNGLICLLNYNRVVINSVGMTEVTGRTDLMFSEGE